MLMRTMRILVVGPMLGLFLSGVALAVSPEVTSFREEVRVVRAQAKAYAETKRSEIRQLKQSIQTLKSQAKSAEDPAAKAQLRGQIHTLREQMCGLMEGLAQYRVVWAEQGITFANRRAGLARDRLAKLQAREDGMEPGQVDTK